MNLQDNSNLGLLDSIDSTNYAAVNQRNEEITPSILQEEYLQLVNRIYLATWAEGIYEMDSLQYSALEPIAFMNALEGGPAVYGARVLLGIEPQEPEEPQYRVAGSKKLVINYTTGKEEIFFGDIFPNPNTGIMEMQYQLPYESRCAITVNNVLGVRVHSQYIENGSGNLGIDVRNLPAGTYVYEITDERNLIKRGKFGIVKN